MKADSEGRWKGEEKISGLSQSLPSSLQIDICNSDSAEEMDQRHSTLGAKPKWCAHADRPCTSGEESSTTTIHHGGISHSGESLQQRQSRGLSEQPRCGVKQQYEALLGKHTIRVHQVDDRI